MARVFCLIHFVYVTVVENLQRFREYFKLDWPILVLQIHGKSIPAEIALLQHLKKHNNIIKLVDWFEDNNEFIIVTDWSPEYVDLFDYLTSRNPLDECCARRIFKQVR